MYYENRTKRYAKEKVQKQKKQSKSKKVIIYEFLTGIWHSSMSHRFDFPSAN